MLNKNNALKLKEGLKKFSGSFLFGYEKELYQFYNTFQINIRNENYDACGSGCYHAISSLFSTEGLNITPKERLKRAIECANEFVVSVDNKIDYIELEIK